MEISTGRPSKTTVRTAVLKGEEGELDGRRAELGDDDFDRFSGDDDLAVLSSEDSADEKRGRAGCSGLFQGFAAGEGRGVESFHLFLIYRISE